MQELISRFGGTPALILKILFLGVINAAAIWAIPALIGTENWVMLGILVVTTAGIDFFLLARRFVPGKYVVIGASLLLIFQIIPILYTVAIAFTNYSTGHIGTKDEAIATIQRDSLSEGDNAISYDMLPLYAEGQKVVLALTEVPTDTGDQTAADNAPDLGQSESGTQTEFGPSDAASPEASVQTEFGPTGDTASAEPSVQTEFGPGTDTASAEPSVQTEFGPGEVSSTAPSPDASSGTDMNVVTPEPPGGWPPTYIGTNQGLDPVPPGDVQRDEFGTVIGVTGYQTVPEADYPNLDTAIANIKVPGPTGGYITAQGFDSAVELTPTVTYDAASDTFTNIQTGAVYVDNNKGSFVNQDNPEDELLPGWRANIGWTNFASIVTNPDVSGPFVYVFLWTFAYALLTVLLTFTAGLGLAITLNKPGMRGQRIYRALLIVPYAVPAFLSALVFAGLLNDDFGAINQTFGISIPWLFDPFWAKVSCLMLNFWLGVPYMFLISTGALQAIPSELQEAARIDGARNFQVFRLVNLPLLLVALTPLLVASFAFNFNNFNNIYLLTGGGPAIEGSPIAGATDILISYTYKIAFAAGKGNDYGLASAISIIIFLIVGGISATMFARSKALREERS
ncbi:MAG: ABC transporter permease subunit [Actinomycetales bacterium]|nr:ABC transporter permease subunit [Actinomycetales bacterium]